MRIVHFDQMFHPDFGDQINILPKFQVKNGHEVIIVTGDSSVPHPRFRYFADNTNMDEKDKEFEIKTGVKIIRVGIKRFISGRAVFKKGFDKIIDNLHPDILFCHFNDTLIGMHYTWKVNKLNYPLILDSHMLEMASQNKFKSLFRLFYRIFMTPIIKKHNIVVIKTQNEDYLNEHLGIPYNLTPYISFGTDTNIFRPDQNIKKSFREFLNIPNDDIVIVYTGKLDESKNGKLLAEAFLRKFDTDRDITLLTVGNIKTEYEKEVESILKKSENKVVNIPTQKYEDLAKYYQVSDIAIFPKQSSLSFFDAQACGLPIIAEDNHINKERLNRNNGSTFRAGNIENLRTTINEIINDDVRLKQMSLNSLDNVRTNFDYKNLVNEYQTIIDKEVQKFYNK